MSEKKTEYRGGGIGFGGMLFLLFLALKLMGYITWSWWWVTSPLWLPLTLILVIGAIFFGLAALLTGFFAAASKAFTKK